MPVQKKKQIATNKNQKQDSQPTNLLVKLDEILSKRMQQILWTGLVIGFVFACLLFECNVSTGGDDSMYIENAWNFLKEGQLPVYKGTFYSVLLSGLIAIFGINIIILKLFSLALIIGSLYFFFSAFREKLAPSVVVVAYIITSVCSYYLYFASQTYTEALYLFLQALLIYLVLKYYAQLHTFKLKDDIRKAAIVSLVALFLFLTRNIGIVAIACIVSYLLLQKEWKSALTLILTFAAIFLLFSLAKYLIWGSQGIFGGSQFAEVSYKSLYNEQMGKEDIGGFVHRFFINSNNFFSKHIYMLMGFRAEHVKGIPILTTLTYALLIMALYFSIIRKNRVAQYLSYHVLFLSITTFFALQETWDQWRQILVYYPYILLLFAYLLYEILKQPKFSRYQWIYPTLFGLIFCTTTSATLSKVPDSTDRLSHNISGEPLYGMTPDWQNYILSSVWAAENLPKQYNIAVRKPNISFIYSHRDFYGIFRLNGSPYETIKKKLKPGYKSVILSMPDAALKKLYPDIAKYTLCVISGSFQKVENMPPPGTLVLYSMPADTLAKFETRFRVTNTRWIKDGFAWLEQQPERQNIYYFDPDHLLEPLYRNHVRYFILASLRLNPLDKEVGVIETLHKYFMVIEFKYPGCIKLIHEDGDSEKAGLFELNIPALWK
ncbi:MAG: putative rane protein [Bacteroidetes bacterium]|nr:putative rane protein [Bacteroidota bacterium]